MAAVWCKLGGVWLPYPHARAPWLEPFEAELFAVPDGEYLDWADAFAQLIDYLRGYLAMSHQARAGGKAA